MKRERLEVRKQQLLASGREVKEGQRKSRVKNGHDRLR